MSSPVLYVICCAAPPSRDVGGFVTAAKGAGWDVCVLTTPYGGRFVDAEGLESLTGHPVRSEYKEPGTPDVLPAADAVVVAPATVNTINKWGAGICDTLALGILVEAIGLGIPIVAAPYSNRAHAAHPMFVENVGRLRSWGVNVLWGETGYRPHEPKESGGPARYPWAEVLAAVGAADDPPLDS